MQPTPNPELSKAYSPFWPILILAVSLIAVLGWNTIISIQQWSEGYRLTVQQEVALNQGVQAEENLKAMMADLVLLSQRDDAAKTIIKKYNITFNSPNQRTQPGTPAP